MKTVTSTTTTIPTARRDSTTDQIEQEPTQRGRDGVVQMMTTLHLEVMVTSNTPTLLLLQGIAEIQDKIEMKLVGIKAIVETTLHLEVV
jgi:hypothetical protein